MMKTKSIIIALILYMSMIFTLKAQKQNIIKTNLLSPIVGTYHLNYERVISKRGSLQIGTFYTNRNIPIGTSTNYEGFGITPEYRFYLSAIDQAPKGFYIAPSFRYQHLNLTAYAGAGKQIGNSNLYSVGLTVGKQWIFGDLIALDIFIGPAFNSYSYSNRPVEESSIKIFSNNFGFRAGLTLGVAF